MNPYQFVTLATALLVENMQWLASSLVGVTLLLSIFETTAGVLLFIPRFRRWGALIAGTMLLGFTAYFAANYAELKGLDCSCFPAIQLPFGMTLDLQREVGPEFFYSEIFGLAAVVLAGLWAKPATGFKAALLILGTVVVFSSVSVGTAYAARNGAVIAPDSIEVDGQPYSLQSGKQFIFFFDPSCMHCDAAARSMAPLTFADGVDVIAVPVTHPEWGPSFLGPVDEQGTGFGRVAKLSTDAAKLREVFKFEFPPAGVYIEDGVQKGVVPHFEDGGDEHIVWMREHGIIK